MAEITEREQLIYTKLTELSEIYKSVKHIFLLVEYYNEKKGIVVSSVNELRSAFDHVMRAMTKDDQKGLIDEVESAKKHLYRAAYDACEVIILDRLDYIESLKSMVSFKTLSKIYPEYATEVLPFAAKLKKEVVEVRKISDLKERVNEYEDKISKLISYSELLEQKIPDAMKLREKDELESLLSPSFVTLLAGAVLAMVSLLSYFRPETSIVWQATVGVAVASLIVVSYLFRRKRGGNG